MDYFPIFFLLAVAIITMNNLFIFKLDYRAPTHNHTNLIRVPHGVYRIPHKGRRCHDDCVLVEFNGFP